MRCLYPRTVGFKSDGRTISWSQRSYSKEYDTFQLPCGKCIECRLEYARSAAIRCVHEAKMFSDNSFITLTYSDSHVGDGRLRYYDFQSFMKRLRDDRFRSYLKQLGISRSEWKGLSRDERSHHLDLLSIGFFATGEYGDITKRPHWHALLFNYRPDDLVYRYSNDRGDRIFTSATIDALWGFNDSDSRPSDIGDVSFESAGYVARYAAKKLVHGVDGSHDFSPIHKRSSRYAIGKRFVETYWNDIFFGSGCMVDRSDGSSVRCAIPRYYEKWLLKHRPDDFIRYVSEIKAPRISAAESAARIQSVEEDLINANRHWRKGFQVSRSKVREKIITERFNRLQGARKGE